MNRILKQPQMSEEDQQTIRSFFRDYEFAQWTVPANLHELSRYRSNFYNQQVLRRGSKGFDFVNQVAVEMLPELVRGDFHPAVRANATLAIGELNQSIEAMNSPPEPFAAAADFLLAELQNPDQIDPVRVAALNGLQRHAELGIRDQAKRQDVQSVLLTLVDDPEAVIGEPESGSRRPEVRDWIRTRSLKVLAAIGEPGQNGDVAKKMVALIGDADAPTTLRLAAARGLADIRLTTAMAEPLQLATTVPALNELAIQSLAPALEAFESRGADLPQRSLQEHVFAAWLGMSTVATKIPEGPDREKATAMADKLAEALDLFNPEEPPFDDDLAADLRSTLPELGPAVSGPDDGGLPAPTTPTDRPPLAFPPAGGFPGGGMEGR